MRRTASAVESSLSLTCSTPESLDVVRGGPALSSRVHVRILVASGHSRGAESLRVLLRAMPDVEVVGQGDRIDSVWQLITEHCPDLLLVDLSPWPAVPHDVRGDAERDSYTLLRRTAAYLPEIGRLALVVDEEQSRAACAAGATDVVSSPVTLDRLQAGIEKAINGARNTVAPAISSQTSIVTQERKWY